MKTLICADLAATKLGSLECQIFGVAHRLRDAGARVQVALAGEAGPQVLRHFQWDDAAPTLAQSLGELHHDAARRRWLEHLQAERPDVLWLHFFPINGYFLWQICRACPHARICSTEHVSRGLVRRSPIRSAFHRVRHAFTGRIIHRHIAVSRFVARRLQEVDGASPESVRTIYNGVDLSRFKPQDKSGDYLAAVCCMRPEKGVHVLLEALKTLKHEGTELPCKIVGAGKELERYRATARDAGLRQVEFLGLRDDVPEVLGNAMLTIVPSVWPEAFGLAAAESLASGVPVVASDVGALPEVVPDGECGSLVPPGDAAALARAIRSLAEQPQRRRAMGHAGRRRAERLFDLEQCCDQVAHTLLEGRPRSSPRPGSSGIKLTDAPRGNGETSREGNVHA